MQSTETWKPVSGYEGYYEVSTLGRVRSIDRKVRHPRGGEKRLAAREMTQQVNRYGYQVVCLSKSGKYRTHTVHRLVASAFLDCPDESFEVCHGDGNRSNNYVSNLRWDSRSGNARDALAHRTHSKASRSACPSGHPYSGENLITTKAGNRQCKTCKRDWMRAYNSKTKGK